jgi:hypothetical protein
VWRGQHPPEQKKQGSDVVEGLTPSEREEPPSTTSNVSVRGDRNVGALAIWDNLARH